MSETPSSSASSELVSQALNHQKRIRRCRGSLGPRWFGQLRQLLELELNLGKIESRDAKDRAAFGSLQTAKRDCVETDEARLRLNLCTYRIEALGRSCSPSQTSARLSRLRHAF